MVRQINQPSKEKEMGNQPNVDEGIVLDLSLFRRDLVRHLSSDGEYCERDAALVARFDEPHERLSRITRLRGALETVIRCGISKHSRAVARDAGVAFITSGKHVTNVVQLTLDTQKHSDRGNDPSAA